MFKKLSIITAITLASFSLAACGGSEEVTPEENAEQASVENTQTEQTATAPKAQEPSNPYLDANWDAFKSGVENESLISAIDASVANYKKAAEKVINDGESYIDEISSQIGSSIDEGKAAISDQQAVFDENCQDISSEEQQEQCSDIEENIFNTQERIKGMEVELKNRVGEIEAQMNNQLKKIKTNLMNNINKKRNSEGLDKANPFETE